MIYIIHKMLSSADKEGLQKILSHVGISPPEVKFVDIASEDIDIVNKDFIFAINTYKNVARSLISNGMFQVKELLGSDIYDPATKFALVNIPYSVQELFSNDDAKNTVWNKLLTFFQFYTECGKTGGYESTLVPGAPFDDPLPDFSAGNEKPVVTDVVPSLPVGTEEITINCVEFINLLAKSLDLSDPSVGKSLSLLKKVVLETDTVSVHVYPNNRISAKDSSQESELHISFKDTIAILRAATMFEANTVTFFKEKE